VRRGTRGRSDRETDLHCRELRVLTRAPAAGAEPEYQLHLPARFKGKSGCQVAISVKTCPMGTKEVFEAAWDYLPSVSRQLRQPVIVASTVSPHRDQTKRSPTLAGDLGRFQRTSKIGHTKKAWLAPHLRQNPIFHLCHGQSFAASDYRDGERRQGRLGRRLGRPACSPLFASLHATDGGS
jgi:hypothetical protein